ncbi:MAG: hypothetical protein ACLGQW_07670, partial [Acidobacteriota bacterium]
MHVHFAGFIDIDLHGHDSPQPQTYTMSPAFKGIVGLSWAAKAAVANASRKMTARIDIAVFTGHLHDVV